MYIQRFWIFPFLLIASSVFAESKADQLTVKYVDVTRTFLISAAKKKYVLADKALQEMHELFTQCGNDGKKKQLRKKIFGKLPTLGIKKSISRERLSKNDEAFATFFYNYIRGLLEKGDRIIEDPFALLYIADVAEHALETACIEIYGSRENKVFDPLKKRVLSYPWKSISLSTALGFDDKVLNDVLTDSVDHCEKNTLLVAKIR
jgi:hypothetical protein